MNDILKDYRKKINNAKAVKEAIANQITKLEKELYDFEKSLNFAESALLILQIVAKQTQEQLEYKISELVSLALSSVFSEPYTMKLNYDTKRNKTEAAIIFEKNNKQFDPMTSTGGGVIDIASFALRISLWNLSRSKTDNVFIFDEPFRFVSKDKIEKVGQMLQEISKKLNIQIIMITHIKKLIDYADNIFIVEQQNGVSKIEKY